MFIVAMYRLSHYYNEPGIFKNIIYAIIVAVVGSVALFAGINRHSSIQIRHAAPATASGAGFFIIGFLGILGAFFVIGLFSCLFFKRAFNKLAQKSGVTSFDTAGLLIVLGVIIPFIILDRLGFLQLSGFNSLKPKPTETSSAYYTSDSDNSRPQRKTGIAHTVEHQTT